MCISGVYADQTMADSNSQLYVLSVGRTLAWTPLNRHHQIEACT